VCEPDQSFLPRQDDLDLPILGDGLRAFHCERPHDLDALKEAARRCAEAETPIFPRGGATALDYGNPPARSGAAFDLTRLHRVIDYPAADLTITVEAGLTLHALARVLAAENQWLPLDVPEADRATVGGLYATNFYGPRRYGWGRPRDAIIGVGFVNTRGQLIQGGGRVVKNVAGYDFPKLMTGAVGTLGILAQITLKLRPRPESNALVWVILPNAATAERRLTELNLSQARPTAIELLNAPAARQIALLLDLPAPAQDDPQALALVVGVEDNADSVTWQLDRLVDELSRTDSESATNQRPDVAALRDDRAGPLWSILTELTAAPLAPAAGLNEGAPLPETPAVSLAANLVPSQVAELVSRFDPRRWMVQAHAGDGLVRAHLITPEPLEVVQHDVEQARRFAVAAKGNLILPRCPTAWKPTLNVWGAPRPDWAIARQIKQALDPHHLLNPGRFIDRI